MPEKKTAPKTNAPRKKAYRILAEDPYLEPYREGVELRMKRYEQTRKALVPKGARLTDFANGHLYYGFHPVEGGWVYREWAPKARALHLIGDFNGWNRASHPLTQLEHGNWEIFLEGKDALPHASHVKVQVTSAAGVADRIPLYITRVVQDKRDNTFVGQIWHPEESFVWTDGRFSPSRAKPLLIYEAHIGMAQERAGVGTYREFTQNVLPYIQRSGYNAIQLMAVMEHPYYASFGYQVSNFFAASSWFGVPEDLKELINTAHRMGIAVLLDLVHSHAVKNTVEGIDQFDGSQDQFFLPQDHPAWHTKLFNYGKHEVLHFLLSNIKFWMQEYHFDGFRFDGVTSMLYHDHGLGTAFTSYGQYFGPNTNVDAEVYLMLANQLIHQVKRSAVTIAEDMSGMPGMALKVAEGGLGFDYRLGMGIPDYWIKTLKERADEAWQMGDIWYQLTNRRCNEKTVAYAESHDQALVGDKTLMFRLADAEMYTHMDKASSSLVIDRAMALHKMIRLVTLTLGGEGYLNFMGNEFGHPEWIDFPREGNGWSYQYARRQWSLEENGYLRYGLLAAFDRDMLALAKAYPLLEGPARNLWQDEGENLLVFEKGSLIFVFNFHPTHSQSAFTFPVPESGDYQVIFDSDQPAYGGFGRIDRQTIYHAGDTLTLYSPARTALALSRR
ncbi:MAG: alpha amylase C-terminal domain-containing protein [Christensenellales bacterium]